MWLTNPEMCSRQQGWGLDGHIMWAVRKQANISAGAQAVFSFSVWSPSPWNSTIHV